MNDTMYNDIAKQLAKDAIYAAEREIQEEYKSFCAATQKKGRLLAENAIRDAVYELEDERHAALEYLESQIAKETVVPHICDKALDLAYDRLANTLAIDAINEASDELQYEFTKRMEQIAAFDWDSVDKHIKETLDARKAVMRGAERRNQVERRGTPLVAEAMRRPPLAEEGCLPNSVSDSVIDTRPWRRYVTIDMGDVVVRAHSDTVNFYISPRDTPSPTDLYPESPRGYDVITPMSQIANDNKITTNKDLGISYDPAASSARVNQEENELSKEPKNKKGFVSRCMKFFRRLFSCHKAQNVD